MAYSLGDFTTFAKPDKYLYGIIVKAEIGPNPNTTGRWQVGKVEWRFTYVNHIDANNSRIELTEGFKYFELPQVDKQDY